MRPQPTAALTVVLTAALFAGCTPAGPVTGGSGTVSATAKPTDLRACLLSSPGGFDDDAVNAGAFAGLQRVAEDTGVRTVSLETGSAADLTPGIDSMLAQHCGLVIAVGAGAEDAVQTAAQANRSVDFALVGSALRTPEGAATTSANVRPVLFNTAQAAYLAGYLAAAVSETGKVGVFGGVQDPGTMLVMDGFHDGVAAYNTDKKAGVQLLGWVKDTQTGTFSGDTTDAAKAQTSAQSLIDGGADIVLPVAGAASVGAAQAAKAKGGVKLIWVGSDGHATTDYPDLMLTSILSNADPGIYDTVTAASEGRFDSEPFVGTLANGGVGLAPFHTFESQVKPAVVAEVKDLSKKIVDGDVTVASTHAP